MTSSKCEQMPLVRHVTPAPGLVPGLNYPRCRRARCRAPQGLSRAQMRNWRRQRASARELVRIHELRLGFDILATVVPKKENEKLSKVQVLRYAMEYIEQLAEMNKLPAADPSNATEVADSNVGDVWSQQWQQYQAASSDSDDSDAHYMSLSAASPSSTVSLSSYSSSSSGSAGSGSSRIGSPLSNISSSASQSAQEMFSSPPPPCAVAADQWSVPSQTATPSHNLAVSAQSFMHPQQQQQQPQHFFSDVAPLNDGGMSSTWGSSSVEAGMNARAVPSTLSSSSSCRQDSMANLTSLVSGWTHIISVSLCTPQVERPQHRTPACVPNPHHIHRLVTWQCSPSYMHRTQCLRPLTINTLVCVSRVARHSLCEVSWG